ncbi:hypothetical protein PQX77_007737 [Marasmius sp. AFHP31]|nr:hypothetical protein PQX77_007737 [Marasmius sp. AFHP31]
MRFFRVQVARVRYVSAASPSTSTSSELKDVPPIITQRKQKLDLHPAPKKLDASSTTPKSQPKPILSKKTTATTSSSSPSPQPPKGENEGVKATLQRDIKNAEELGILKPAPPDANMFRKLMHSAWEMTKFYFRGAKLIYTRQGEIRVIKRRVKSGGVPLTRIEGRMIEQQRKDINKIVPFLIIASLLEEVVPIIALYAPFMLPSTCLLPSQRERIEGKKTMKALSTISTSRPRFLALKAESQDGKLPLTALRHPGSAAMVCSILRLPTFGPDPLRKWRITRHLRFISGDDHLMIKDDVLKIMTKEDMQQALDERGFISQGLTLKECESRLKWWLESVKDSSPEDAIPRRLLLLMERR